MTAAPPVNLKADFARVHDEFARKAADLIAKGKELNPMVFIATPKGGGCIEFQPMPGKLLERFFSTDAGKDEFAELLRDLMAGGPAAAMFRVVFGFPPRLMVQVCEAWQSHPMSEAEYRDPDRPMPKDDPQRSEVLMVMLHTPDGTYATRHQILPGPPRRVELVGFLEDRRDGFVEQGGRFFLPPEGQGQTKQ